MKLSNVGDLLKNMGKIRKDIEKIQTDLRGRVVEAASGGGLVKVLLNGQQEILKVQIDPKVLASGGAAPAGAAGLSNPGVASDAIAMLEDLLVAAFSQGLEKSKALKNEELQKATGGLGLNFSDLL